MGYEYLCYDIVIKQGEKIFLFEDIRKGFELGFKEWFF